MLNNTQSHGMFLEDISNQNQLDFPKESADIENIDEDIVIISASVDRIEEIINHQHNDDQNCLQWMLIMKFSKILMKEISRIC